MSETKHTPGPWYWHDDGSNRYSLRTPDRGQLIVMDFARKGMNGAAPRFAVMDDDQPRGRRGGILTAVDPATHPDGLLIAAAPDLFDALRKIAERDTSKPATIGAGMSPHLAAALAWDIDAEIARAAIAKATK